MADTLDYNETIKDDENSFPNLSVDKSNHVPPTGENTKEFLNFIYNNYKVIN